MALWSSLPLLGLILSCLGSWPAVAVAASFPCPITQPAKAAPTNATDVHPAHVSIVMAMGDSITAAFAASSLFVNKMMMLRETGAPIRNLKAQVGEAPLEFRELSFSGGQGNDEYLTLPYFLHHYNSSLTGFSTGRTLPQLPSTGYKSEDINALNVALSNSHSWELTPQIKELKKQTQNIPDFARRWKILTVLIGANDLCDGMGHTGFEACDGDASHAGALVDRYETWVRAALTDIRDSMQNIIVQLVSQFSIASVLKARSNHFWCNVRTRFVDECNCIDRTANGKGGAISQQQLDDFDNTTNMLNERIQKLTEEFNLQRPDFAVINAVAGKGQAIPDISFLSELDCFHPSAHAHGATATALWNGLFDKHRAPAPLDAAPALFCPTADSVIYVEEPSKLNVVMV